MAGRLGHRLRPTVFKLERIRSERNLHPEENFSSTKDLLFVRFQGTAGKQQIPRLRFAPLGMTIPLKFSNLQFVPDV